MSGLICLATMELLIQTLALSPLADEPTPPDVEFLVIDDFESYTDEDGHRIFQTWIDGWSVSPPSGRPGNGTCATVGHLYPPFAEQEIVHDGRQCMPIDYNNLWGPHYSETDRLWDTPQDWTVRGMNTLGLWFRGEAGNSTEPFYVALEDNEGWTGGVEHPDPNALLATEWREWQIRLTTFAFGPVDLTGVKQLYIGIGDRQNPKPGGAGAMYIDDIRLLRCAPLAEPNEPDFLLIDDFESYRAELGYTIRNTWADGWGLAPDAQGPGGVPPLGNGSGASIGRWVSQIPLAEQEIVHSGRQSMPMDYDDSVPPWYSETDRSWDTPQDWSHFGMTTLSLWFRGEADNSPEPSYVALEDSKRTVGVVNHPDPNALLATEWQQWRIPLLTFARNKVDIAVITRMYIGIGDRKKPQPGGAGTVYIDDITLMRRKPEARLTP